MKHFDPQNDRVVGSYDYMGRSYPLLEYRKDPAYRPKKGTTTGTVGGRHRIIYVDGPRYIRVPIFQTEEQ